MTEPATSDQPAAVTRDLDGLIAEQSARDPEFAAGVADTERRLTDGGMRYDPATGSVVIPADWLPPRADDIPLDVLAALQTGAVDLADGIRLGYRVGWAAKAGHEVTVDDAGRVQIGDRPELIDWDKVLRERDSLARRLAGRFEETEKLRARIAVLEASPRAWAPSQGQEIPDDQLDAVLEGAHRTGLGSAERGRQAAHDAYRIGYAAALGYEIEITDGGRVGVGDRPEPPDRLVGPVVNWAIGWRQTLAANVPDLSTEERHLAAAVDNYLDRQRQIARESGALSTPAAERGPVVPQSTQDGSGGSDGPPVTPAADLADEAGYERVAQALRAKLGTVDAFEDPVKAMAERQVAYDLAKAAIDAYRAGQPSEHVASGAITDLLNGLHFRVRDITARDADPQAVVSAALAHFDRLTTALDEAARETLDAASPVRAVGRCGELMPPIFDTSPPVHCALLATHPGWHRSEGGTEWSRHLPDAELEAVYDDGLSTDQEIRARALPEAARLVEGMEHDGDTTIRDVEETTIGVADRLADWIATGSYEWMADNPAQLRDRLDAASRALTTAREQILRERADGYAEAVRRLRESDHREAGVLARYLENSAPDRAVADAEAETGADIGQHGGEIYVCGNPDVTPTPGSPT